MRKKREREGRKVEECMGQETTETKTKQLTTNMNHLPSVDWFTQVNETAILNVRGQMKPIIHLHLGPYSRLRQVHSHTHIQTMPSLSLLFYTTLTLATCIHNLIPRHFPFFPSTWEQG